MKKVIYHGNCNDGFCAAWVAHGVLGEEAKYIAANYGGDPPDVRDAEVYIVDFSYPREVLLAMHAAARSLVVLDHHKTAEADLVGLEFCEFDMHRSGAMMAWDYWHPGEQPAPWPVAYVQDRDLWRWELPNSKEINAAITTWEQTFSAWDAAIEKGLEHARAEGRAISRYIDQYTAEMIAQAINVDFEGHRVPCVNAPYKGISEICGALAETALFSIGWHQRASGKFVYSLRSRGDFDVSALAKRYGGGGHKNSAGFVSDKLIFHP